MSVKLTFFFQMRALNKHLKRHVFKASTLMDTIQVFQNKDFECFSLGVDLPPLNTGGLKKTTTILLHSRGEEKTSKEKLSETHTQRETDRLFD